MLLEQINHENDIKKIKIEKLNRLAEEIRQFLIHKISITGGHLASNLGVVELTMAMHLAFQLPEDKMIWDVGHQAYTHKLLTGRKEGFDELRKYGGMSGFPKRKESACDSFDTGHSSTSISAGLGYVEARDLQNQKHKIISVIGDGALTGGMAYEALNNAAKLDSNFIIILNDNNMSISENVGGISKHLNNIRTAKVYNNLKSGVVSTLSRIPICGENIVDKLRKTKSSLKQLVIPGMMFENMGLTYLGPVDGHHTMQLVKVLKEASKLNNAVVIHVMTKKGKGYTPAEQQPSRFHGIEPFHIATGNLIKSKKCITYTDSFSSVIAKLGGEDEKISVITAAMPDGTGLKHFQKLYPKRFFDVGIAEEHAVTFAAGLAAGGMKPVVAVYSSFLQRAYDQILHDVCIQNLPVVFAIDRAGLVGSDGETHQGIFDLSFLSSIPNMHILAPKNRWELVAMIRYAVGFGGPIAVRYPRGEAYCGLKDFRTPIEYGESEWIYKEKGIALFAAGSMVKLAEEVRGRLKQLGYECSLVNARFIKPIDSYRIEELSESHPLIVTLEENVLSGSMGEKVMHCVADKNLKSKVMMIGLPDEYVEHGNVELLKKELGIDKDTIIKKIIAVYTSL